MKIQELVNKYNNALTGLFKNNAPNRAINATTLREFVTDLAGTVTELTAELPFTLRAEWITLSVFPVTLLGAGVAALVDSVAGYFGLLQVSTTGAAGGGHVTSAKVLIEKPLLIRTRMFIPLLSTVAEAFYYRFGLLADLTVRNQVNGIYFEYSHDINGGAWVLQVYKANVLVQTLTAIPVVINTAYELTILVRPGNGVVFSINGAVVGFVAQADLPVTLLQYANGLRKFNGAANRNLLIDSDLLIYNLAI